MKLYDLKTLHMSKAVGIDQKPYFSWKIESDENNVRQQGYQIVVAEEENVVWDSGKVKSQKQSFVEYEGMALTSMTEYTWKVQVWDNRRNVCDEEGAFETGILDKKLWKANWVESSIPRIPATEYKLGNAAPAVLFEKKFVLDKNIKNARMYATAYGVYQAKVNEKRPDDREFAPEFTAYESVLYYQTHDITGLLKKGENTVELYVGDGWYFSLQASPVMGEAHKAPAVLFQIEIEYEDGSKISVQSDGSEMCTLGYICYSDIFQGEKQDYRIQYDKKPVIIKDYGYKNLAAQPMPPVRPMKLIPAVNIFTSPNGEMIVDFGQMLAGRARIQIDVPKDTEVVFEYFEILDENGNYINTMFAPQKDIVISDGNPITHEALFTFHGFRYIRITGMEHAKKEDFTAVLLTTEKDNLGGFTCSDERMNRLYQNIRWSQYNNMMSIPTDCPSREKAGWTGDILIFAKTALMNEDMTPFLTSWLASLRENQADDGTVMIIAPYTKMYQGGFLNIVKEFGDEKATGVAGWSDAIVWVPYEMYRVTGNKIVLKQNYEAMKKWCEYIIRTAREKRGYREIPEMYDRYLWNTGFHFGEWLVPSQLAGQSPFEYCKTSSYYIAPFFGYKTMCYMSEISETLGKSEDAVHYKAIADKMKHAIQQGIMYGGHMPDELMGAYIIAFAFELVPEELQAPYHEKLVSLIHDNQDCLDTGFLATPFILDALTKIGEKELVYTILWQDKQPSWLYEVDHGATSIWEAWDADEAERTGRLVSFDHYAFGCVENWICRTIAGIDSDTPGFTHVIINPKGDPHLTRCERFFESEAGEVRVKWDEENLSFTIPCNATATVTWKNQTYEFGSGSYQL